MPKNKCCGCKERFDRDTMIRLPAGLFHTIECASQYAYNRQARAAKIASNKESKALKTQHRADKESLKPLSKLKAEAQTEFNKYIRLRDYWEPCISCGTKKEVIEFEQGWKVGGCWDAGHFKSRGARPQLRFNTFNVHKECKSCNAGSAKFSAKAETVGAKYRANLINKIGLEKVEELECNNESGKVSGDYCRRIKVIFRKRARILRKKLDID